MSAEKKTKGGKKLVSRREVLAGAGATIVSGALMGSGALAASNETEKKAGKAAAQKANGCNVPLGEQVWDFEKKPDPIPASKIKETITADIVIVGSGGAGMPCAAAAMETGAKVIVLEKLSKDQTFDPKNFLVSRAIGGFYGFSGSRIYKKRKREYFFRGCG